MMTSFLKLKSFLKPIIAITMLILPAYCSNKNNLPDKLIKTQKKIKQRNIEQTIQRKQIQSNQQKSSSRFYLDNGPPFKQIIIHKKSTDNQSKTLALSKENVYLTWYWESINNWFNKGNALQSKDRYLWPFPDQKHRLWLGFYNRNSYPVQIDFKATFSSKQVMIIERTLRLDPLSGWSSRKKSKNYGQFQWGSNAKPYLNRLYFRIQKLDEYGNIISPYYRKERKKAIQREFNLDLLKGIRFLDVESTQKAITKGADVNLSLSNRRTPLITACISPWAGEEKILNRQFKIVKLLLANGAKVNSQDSLGKTALHWSAMNGNYKVVALLTKYKADTKALDKANKSPLDYALIQQKKARKAWTSGKRFVNKSKNKEYFWHSGLEKVIYTLKYLKRNH